MSFGDLGPEHEGIAVLRNVGIYDDILITNLMH